MKLSLIALCLLPLTLASADRALSQSMTAPLVAKSTPAPEGEHKNYINSQTSELALWRRRVAGLDARAETSVTKASEAAKLDIRAAWSTLEKSSMALQGAGTEGWRSAKSAYEGAKLDLQAKWAKFEASKT